MATDKRHVSSQRRNGVPKPPKGRATGRAGRSATSPASIPRRGRRKQGRSLGPSSGKLARDP